MFEDKLPFDDINLPYGITYETIEELLETTNLTFFECHDALVESKGNFEAAKRLLIPTDSYNVVGFQDFFIKTDVYKCKNKKHEIEEISAIVYCLLKNGDIIEKTVMAGYCSQCNVYYILNKDFEKLKVDCQLMCRIVDNSVNIKKGNGFYSSFKEESIMRQYGYNVNLVDGLTKIQRQTILEFLICSNVLTKTEICSHLDWLIESRSYDTLKYSSAIDKWNEDRIFVSNYKCTPERKVIVRKITKGKNFC